MSKEFFPRDEVVSTVTQDSMSFLCKKYHFPSEVIVKVPRSSDRARAPPPGYLTIYEMNFRAGLRFPPPTELMTILSAYSMCLSQISFRALTIIIGLIVFFRQHKAKLTPEILTRMCKISNYAHDRIACRGRQLDLRSSDPGRNWSSRYFYVRNDWNLLEKWGVIVEQPIPLHLQEEDILKLLGIQDVEALQFEIKFMSKFVSEEALFQVGLSIQPGRSQAEKLRRTEKTTGRDRLALKALPMQQQEGGGENLSKRKKVADPSLGDADFRVSVPEEILTHLSVGYRDADAELFKLGKVLKGWNSEFVKNKYLCSEYRKRSILQAREVTYLENQLAECRAELSTMATSLSLQRQEVDRVQEELAGARAETLGKSENLKVSEDRVLSLEVELQTLRDQASQREALIGDSRAVETFKKSYAFKSIIQDHVEAARAHIMDVEVKDQERQCFEEGFFRGFLKGVRLVHRQTGAEIEGLTPSQASEDPVPQDVDDDAESAIRVDDDSD